MEWWDKERQSPARRAAPPKPKAKLPFDFLLLVNSAAPAIYAKELRDFLEADRVALETAGDPDADVPVIVSVTSRADWATGLLHPLGNVLAALPSDTSSDAVFRTNLSLSVNDPNLFYTSSKGSIPPPIGDSSTRIHRHL